MKLKTAGLIVLLTGILFSCQQANVPQEAHLTIIFPENMSVAPVIFDGQLALLDPDYRVYRPQQNDAGDWVVTIPVEEPQYFLLRRNQLFLSPGDSLVIQLSAEPTETIITGRGAEVNTYLKYRFFTRGGSFLRSGRMIGATFEETFALIDSAANHRRQELMALNADALFTRLEVARINANIANSIFFFPTYNPNALLSEGETTLTREKRNAFFNSVWDIIEPLLQEISTDKRYLDVEAVRRTLLNFHISGFDVPSEDFLRLFAVADESNYIRGTLSREEFEHFATFGETIQCEDMKRVFMNRLERNSRFVEGRPAIDIAVLDLDGNEKKLSDLSDGRVMYVDVWATWCGPCRLEKPHFIALSNRFENIHFVAVSVDDLTPTWSDYMRGRESGAVTNVWAGREMQREWEISGIPRFLLLDGDFNIIQTNAPRPSNAATIVPLLEKLNAQ